MNFLIRHGESRYNAGLTKDLDSELTSKGKEQAEFASAHLLKLVAEENIVVWHSRYRRAKQTAEIIANKLGGELRLDERINEVQNAHAGFPEVAWETAAQLWGRLKSFYNDVLAKPEFTWEGDPIANIVVSHGTPCHTIRNMYLGYDYVPTWGEPDKVRNCEVIVML